MTKEQKKIKKETEEKLREVILAEEQERVIKNSPVLRSLLAIFN